MTWAQWVILAALIANAALRITGGVRVMLMAKDGSYGALTWLVALVIAIHVAFGLVLHAGGFW